MVKGKAWFRIKDPPVGEGQVGQSQTHLKDHLIDFFHLPFYPFTLLLFYLFDPFKSNYSPLFWRGAGGEAPYALRALRVRHQVYTLNITH